MTQENIRSPITWIGGKFYLAKRILASFPPVEAYDIYVEPFGGAAHILIQKPPAHHTEIYNDINDDLVNFWMHMRDHAHAMQERLESLPYARSLYYAYHTSLYDGTSLSTLERAVRWFYVLRSSYLPEAKTAKKGWGVSSKNPGSQKVKTYFNALQLFESVKRRFRSVEIDNRNFIQVISRYQSPRTLLYVDPPYVDAEQYYKYQFTLDDHKSLAKLLNEAPGYVALSYYSHPLLNNLYPSSHWRRVEWETRKHSQRSRKTHDIAHEVLLMNY
jgi:DNA adenine methylase